jgi:DNA-binding NarL/FixJ family response regulator
MTDKLRVLIADDQQLIREGLRTLLDMEPDIVVVAEAATGAEAVALHARFQPDVTLMDIHMSHMNGIEATHEICTADPSARVLILTTFDNDDYIFDGLRAGACGYLLKVVSVHDIAEAIRTAAQGGASLNPTLAAKVVSEFARLTVPSVPTTIVETLSPREREILALFAKGLTNREIGAQLFLTEGTVKNYATTIFQKLGVQDRTQAALRARDMGLQVD